MDIEALKSIFSDFDLAAFLPRMDSVLGWVETLLRLCVMAGPLLLLGFGLLYLVAPPKEANHSLGYRFWWSMASLQVWTFTHKLVGIAWTVLGLVLTVIMAVMCNAFRRMAPMDMVWSAVQCLIWELILTVAVCLIANIVIMVMYDRKGFPRWEYESEP